MTEQRIEKNKLVQITYQIHDRQGHLLERVDLPISYLHGRNSGLFPQIEAALDGCTAGQEVTVTLSPADGFGDHRPELTYTDDIANVPEQFHRLGAEVEFQNERGEVKVFRVSHIENGKLTVDGNHPLAGQTLTYTVRVEAVRDPTPDELSGAAPAGSLRVH